MRYIIPVSGKDSLATALVQRQRESSLPYEYLYNDTHMELPETYEWLERVEKYLGQKIHRVGEDLKEIIYGFNYLHSHKDRYCTRMAKIHPMEDWIGVGSEAHVYYGIRADERRTGYKSFSSKFQITPVYPLQEMGFTLPLVWQYVSEFDLMPPPVFLARDV
jgi:3'-phosphoadenosine 5'-phosphosulfate sulfotransferase (PAPS reductase)/FAD synthetase